MRTELAVLSARLEVCILATAFGIQSQLNLPAWLNVFRRVLTVKSCLPSTNVFVFFFPSKKIIILSYNIAAKVEK